MEIGKPFTDCCNQKGAEHQDKVTVSQNHLRLNNGVGSLYNTVEIRFPCRVSGLTHSRHSDY